VNSGAANIALQPGEFRIYTDVKLPDPEAELMSYLPPLAPDFTSAEFTDGEVMLNWIDRSSLETEYKIYRRAAGDVNYELVGTASQNATSFTDDGAFESVTEYEYYVEASNVFGAVKSEALTVSSGIITGIPEEILGAMTLFPNPSSGMIHLKSDSYVAGLRAALYDAQGRKMPEAVIKDDAIDISNYQSGIYILKIAAKNSVRYFKVIKD
jgi:hypothetical protein